MLYNGKELCNCIKKDCPRHGKCDECVEFHKTNKREPYCMRTKANHKDKDGLNSLPNIGRMLEINLNLAGIHSASHLRSLGSHRAFIMLRLVDASACLNSLCALEGAIQGIRWHNLDISIKDELKAFFNAIKDDKKSNIVKPF